MRYGCPVEEYIKLWRGIRDDPSGLGVGTSIQDAIARVLERECSDA
jgi:hypothetical protein